MLEEEHQYPSIRVCCGMQFNINQSLQSSVCARSVYKCVHVHTAGQRNLTVGDPEWEHAKWAFKCTVLTGVTVKVCAQIHFSQIVFMQETELALDRNRTFSMSIRLHIFRRIIWWEFTL